MTARGPVEETGLAEIIEVLNLHIWFGPADACKCGWVPDNTPLPSMHQHRAHLASVLAPIIAAEVEAAVEAEREVTRRWEALYREAVGVPASVHQQRRMEEMAQRTETAVAAAVEAAAVRVEAAYASWNAVGTGHGRALHSEGWLAERSYADAARVVRAGGQP